MNYYILHSLLLGGKVIRLSMAPNLLHCIQIRYSSDTRVRQTRVHLTDFVEAHASCSHAGCMAREHMHDRIHSTRHARAVYATRYARSLSHANRCTRVANAWGEINKVERPSSIIYSVF